MADPSSEGRLGGAAGNTDRDPSSGPACTSLGTEKPATEHSEKRGTRAGREGWEGRGCGKILATASKGQSGGERAQNRAGPRSRLIPSCAARSTFVSLSEPQAPCQWRSGEEPATPQGGCEEQRKHGRNLKTTKLDTLFWSGWATRGPGVFLPNNIVLPFKMVIRMNNFL